MQINSQAVPDSQSFTKAVYGLTPQQARWTISKLLATAIDGNPDQANALALQVEAEKRRISRGRQVVTSDAA